VQQTASQAILQTLTKADVLRETDEGIGLTARIRSQYEPCEPTAYDGPSIVGTNEADERRVRGFARALQACDVPLADEELVAAAVSLAERTAEDSEIVSVRGEDLAALIETEDVLAFVSKKGCDPCDRVRMKLETLLADGVLPDDVVVAEVPGADWQRLLYEEYDVVGAPTLLFGIDGHVEMRLTGDPHVEQLHSDVQRVYAR
jgi:hypothetical protein